LANSGIDLSREFFCEVAESEVIMESNSAEAIDIPAIQEQAEKRQRQQLYESFMRIMALEAGLPSRWAEAEPQSAHSAGNGATRHKDGAVPHPMDL
jgi:hypothetical protein